MSNELGNTPADKNYKPSGINPITKSEWRLMEKQYNLAYKRGHEQAEKDLALTWEDAQLLHIITEKYMRELDNRIEAFPSSSQEVFEEILRRYKEAKK